MQAGLEYVAECTIWSQGVFEPSGVTLDSVLRAVRESDFAALVLTPDDELTKRGKETRAPRDNVVGTQARRRPPPAPHGFFPKACVKAGDSPATCEYPAG